MKMDVVKLLEWGEGFVRCVAVERRKRERTHVNSPTREAALYEARGAARDWGVLRIRLADVASEDVLARPRFLTAPVPWGLGPDAGFFGCEEDAAGVGEAERDEVGEPDSGEETSTLPFLAAESDSISSVSESSIASLGGDCGRVGGALGAVGAFLAAVDAIGAALDGLGLALMGNFVAESPPPEPGRGPEDPDDDTASSIPGLCLVIVASFSLGSLDDPDEARPSVKDLRIEEGGAADTVLIGEFPGPIGDDIWWLSSV